MSRFVGHIFELMQGWLGINFPSNQLTSTKWTVQPDIQTPASSTSLWACMPLKEGSNEGWTFSSLPCHLRTNSAVTILINPAKQTNSTPASSNAACTAISKSKRLLNSLCLITWKKSGYFDCLFWRLINHQPKVSQGSFLFSETNFQDFPRTQIDFSRALKFTLIPTLPRSQC